METKDKDKDKTSKPMHVLTEEDRAKANASRKVNSDFKKKIQAALKQVDTSKYNGTNLRAYLNAYVLDTMFGDDGKWVRKFVDTQLKAAISRPDSKIAERIAESVFTDNIVDNLNKFISDKRTQDNEFKKYLIRSTLYDKQQQVFDDEQSTRFLIINSRRSGKTELMGRLIVKGLLLDDAHIVYINRNSSAAIRQIRKPLQTALDKIGLKCIKGSVESQEMHFENGSQLLIIGNNNSADIDRMRGERISMCICDEVGHVRNMRQLIREVIGPALKDYGKDARLYMVGTPPRNKGTYVEEVWNDALNRGWKLYHWTFLDNPFIPDRETVIDEVCKEQGCEPNSAFIRREYFGEMDAYDDDAKWIKKYSYNENEKIPNTFDFAYVGVDWGYEDKAAVVSIVANKSSGRAYIVDSWSDSHYGVSEVSNEVKRQVENLKENFNLAREPMVIADNNEKGAVWDLYSTYHIKNVYTAYKYDLDYALDQLSELMATNKIMIVKDPSGRVREDCESSLWKRDEETDRIIHELDDDVWHPNAMMAVLYASRQFCTDVLGWIDKNKIAKSILEGRE